MYSHTQIGWMTIIALAGALIFIGAAGKELGPESPGRGGLLATQAVLALLIPLFGWLTVTVDNERVTTRFGMGPGGWIFNVSGLDAVEIELHSGGKFRIGSDEPEALAMAIMQRTGDRKRGNQL